MSTYAQTVLTELGFKRVSYPEFLAQHQEQAREIFGEDVDLSDGSPVGQWIKFISFLRAEENELAEAVFLSGNVDYATGVALDYAVSKFGVTRFVEERGYGAQSLKVTLTAGSTLDAGFIVATSGGIQLRTVANVTDSDNDGTVYADIEAIDYGSSGNVTAGTPVTIQTPVAGVTGASIVLDVVGGRNRESDTELRSRYYRSISLSGGSTTASIRAALLEIPDVRAAIVTENDSPTTDAVGNPPHSVSPVVLGGTPEEIGAAILEKKAAGIQSYGTETVLVRDTSDKFQTIGFSYATIAPIYVNVSLTTNAAFPDNGANLVERQVIQYIGGTDADGTKLQGLGMADPVIHAQVIRSITVPGIDDLTVTLRKGTTGTYEPMNIYMGAVEVAETDAGKVEITVA